MNISPEAYVGELHSGGMILLEAVATFGEELSNARDIVTVEMPTIDLKARYMTLSSTAYPELRSASFNEIKQK